MARFLLLHGFGGIGPDHWLVWLSTELRARGHIARIRKLPSPNAPDLDTWLASMTERLAVLDAAGVAPAARSAGAGDEGGALGTGDAAGGLDEKGDPSGELVVVAHSLGARLWLHHAQEAAAGAPMVDRVALVAPPRLPEGIERSGFHRLDLRKIDPARVARHTRVVVSTNDRYWPGGGAVGGIAEPLGLPVDVVGDCGHLEPPDGYGPWPSMLAWCLGETAAITA